MNVWHISCIKRRIQNRAVYKNGAEEEIWTCEKQEASNWAPPRYVDSITGLVSDWEETSEKCKKAGNYAKIRRGHPQCNLLCLTLLEPVWWRIEEEKQKNLVYA